jgi:hypothetical protein
MSYVENDWVLLPHSSYLRDLRWYTKKRPVELAAVHRNLERFMILLARSPHARTIQAGFLHPEPHGMVAIDQRGGAGRLQETRLYCYAQADTRTLHLLGIGDKSSQSADLARLSPIARTLNS